MKPKYLVLLILAAVTSSAIAQERSPNSTVGRFVSALDSLSNEQAETDALKLATRLTSELKFGSELEKAKHGRSSDQRLLISLRKRKAEDEQKLGEIKAWLRKQHLIVSQTAAANAEQRQNLKQRFMLLVYRQADQVASLEARVQEFGRQIAIMEHRVNRAVAYENTIRDRLDSSDAFGSSIEPLAALPDDIGAVVVSPPASPSDRVRPIDPARRDALKQLYAEVTRSAEVKR